MEELRQWPHAQLVNVPPTSLIISPATLANCLPVIGRPGMTGRLREPLEPVYSKADRILMKLYNCKSEPEQIGWAASHLKAGGRIHDVALWLAGIDRPMRVIAGAKLLLRADGWAVTRAFEKVRDAEGQTHHILSWRASSPNAGN